MFMVGSGTNHESGGTYKSNRSHHPGVENDDPICGWRVTAVGGTMNGAGGGG